MSASEILRRERERKRQKREERGERRARRILRLPEVKQRTGQGKSAIYAAVLAGTFPAPIPLGPRAVGWLEDEVDDWIQAKVDARDAGTAVRSLPLQRAASAEAVR